MKDNWHYIGSTADLRRRLIEHNAQKVRSTKAHSPFQIEYYESYTTYKLARKRELELKKNGQQKEIIYKRLGII